MKDLRISSTRTKYALPALGALAVLSALLSLCLGAVPLGPGEVFSALAGRESLSLIHISEPTRPY